MSKPKRKATLKEWFDNKHRGMTGGYFYPWIKMAVGDWFFVPFHPLKSFRALGFKTKLSMRVRTDWENTVQRVAWVDGLSDWKFEITTREFRIKTGQVLLGIKVERTL